MPPYNSHVMCCHLRCACTDGSGCVDTGELLRALDTHKHSSGGNGGASFDDGADTQSEGTAGAMPCQEAAAVSKTELIELVRAVDEDGNGELNFEEFVELFRDVF